MLTLTAPGETDHRQWWPTQVPGRVPRGRPACGCHLARGSIADWNAGASASWNRLRTALKRDQAGDTDGLEFMRVVEVQKRGALHLHVLVRSPVPLDVLAVQRLAVVAGFGCVLDLASVVPGSRMHAYYVAKYVTKSADERLDVPWSREIVDVDSGELVRVPGVASFRTWSASRGWGLTMLAMREARRALVARQAELAGQVSPRHVIPADLTAANVPGGPEPPAG